jgi:hypothetical protein
MHILNAYASASSHSLVRQRPAWPYFMHSMFEDTRLNLTYNPSSRASTPLTFTYQDALTRDKVNDVDKVNMTGYMDTLSRQIL